MRRLCFSGSVEPWRCIWSDGPLELQPYGLFEPVTSYATQAQSWQQPMNDFGFYHYFVCFSFQNLKVSLGVREALTTTTTTTVISIQDWIDCNKSVRNAFLNIYIIYSGVITPLFLTLLFSSLSVSHIHFNEDLTSHSVANTLEIQFKLWHNKCTYSGLIKISLLFLHLCHTKSSVLGNCEWNFVKLWLPLIMLHNQGSPVMYAICLSAGKLCLHWHYWCPVTLRYILITRAAARGPTRLFIISAAGPADTVNDC